MSAWNTTYERELKQARDAVRTIQSRHHAYAFLVRACDESGMRGLVSSISVASYGHYIYLTGVDDFAKIAPLREWLEANGRGPIREPRTTGTARSFYHRGVTVVAIPPEGSGTEEDDTNCRRVKVGTKRVIPEAYDEDIFKIVCEDEMVGAE